MITTFFIISVFGFYVLACDSKGRKAHRTKISY
jgi:hypothetical protein